MQMLLLTCFAVVLLGFLGQSSCSSFYRPSIVESKPIPIAKPNFQKTLAVSFVDQIRKDCERSNFHQAQENISNALYHRVSIVSLQAVLNECLIHAVASGDLRVSEYIFDLADVNDREFEFLNQGFTTGLQMAADRQYFGFVEQLMDRAVIKQVPLSQLRKVVEFVLCALIDNNSPKRMSSCFDMCKQLPHDADELLSLINSTIELASVQRRYLILEALVNWAISEFKSLEGIVPGLNAALNYAVKVKCWTFLKSLLQTCQQHSLSAVKLQSGINQGLWRAIKGGELTVISELIYALEEYEDRVELLSFGISTGLAMAVKEQSMDVLLLLLEQVRVLNMKPAHIGRGIQEAMRVAAKNGLMSMMSCVVRNVMFMNFGFDDLHDGFQDALKFSIESNRIAIAEYLIGKLIEFCLSNERIIGIVEEALRCAKLSTSRYPRDRLLSLITCE